MREKRSVTAFKAALCRLVRERGLGEVRIKDLCAESGFSRSVFYENFYDKYELAQRLIDDGTPVMRYKSRGV